MRYQHHTTHPAVQELFRNGKLYEDYLGGYPKPFMPPREAKRTMTIRFIEHGAYNYVDRKFFIKERELLFDRIGESLDLVGKNSFLKNHQ